ncbi:hypothetical protein CO230_08120 [Chryseobacterium sp. 6424]|uniref:helix-turn-helix domain-containing protein n=1 Tax=Chryseobacterium sp. 6424 TaxID=2039166 RepID=UPI000EFA97E4|nr:helix-turn-helix transcriptional regulator [Chryseobacterium sp. 6424]AYO58089.1 hypothetical protein CO230_08120 [Chryseobacterium sp. 6424]
MVQDGGLIKLIFGLKVKQLRQRKNLSLQEVAALTGISKSYLNEIENGKKYPKHDKIIPIAAALGCTYNDLVSTKLDKTLAPVMEMVQSDFFKEVPLELFGINKNNLIGIISEAPKQVTAFVNTLIEISKNYNLSKENFYFAVLRSFQELHDNYFEEIEEKAAAYTSKNHLSGNPKSDELAALLQKISVTKLRRWTLKVTAPAENCVHCSFLKKTASTERAAERKPKDIYIRKRNRV